jgi:hypothetical protein
MSTLKGQSHEIFDFRFLHGSVSPKPLIIQLGPFRIFSVSLTPVANFPQVSTTLAKLVAKFAVGVVDTGRKFATDVVDTGIVHLD